ncbi:MAG TPA: AMP-binding protein, partial [Stellaceae bacterium]|nr:AMP-binding protein [Stellaceae bacterium]
MDYASCRSLPAMFFETARQRAERPFLWTKRDGSYRKLSWGEVESAVARLAQALIAYGIEPGDRVALVSENRPEWVIADLAIVSAGAITVPAYVTNTGNDHRHVLGNSGAHAVIVSTAALAGRVLPAAAQTPSIRFAIAMEAVESSGVKFPVYGWDEALAAGAAQPDTIAPRVAALAPDDIACIIYTSGTGGAPKGVLLTHRNIIANCRG